MRLTVLGACGAWPEPGQACSGFLVEHDGFRLLVDAGYATMPRLLEHMAASQLDAVYIVHAHFKSAISTPPVTEKILPVTPPEGKEAKQQDYLLFPSAEEILSSLLPAYVRNMVYRALVENVAAFYSAQRTAMKNATDNASDMLNILRRTYNRARQANITQEIAEIVGGASALQG